MRTFILALAGVAVFATAADKPGAAMLMRLDEQFCESFQTKGVEGWLQYWARDAVAFPQDGPILTRHDEVSRYYRSVFGDRKGTLTWKPAGGQISSAGDLGFTYGTWTSERPGPDGRTVTTTGKYFTTWKKQKDGSWKIVADIGQTDAPAKPGQ